MKMNMEERLEAMQKELDTWKRYTRWMFAVVVLVAGGSLIWGGFAGKPVQAEAAKEVRAQNFVVVDEQGKVRAGLAVGADGSPGLVMVDAQGELRANLMVLSDGSPGLLMYDAQEKTLWSAPR